MTDATYVIDDPAELARTARILRIGLERHRHAVAEHGYCANCADQSTPENERTRGGKSAGPEASSHSKRESSERRVTREQS